MVVADLAERVPSLKRLGLACIASSLPRRIRRGTIKSDQAYRGHRLSDRPLSVDEFCTVAPSFVAHYAVGPAWEPDELRWTLAMAARNGARGPLSLRSVTAHGRPIGCFVHYGTAGEVARVLNVLAVPGKEELVLERMFDSLEEIGCLGSIGRGRPELLSGLSLQPGMVMRHKAFVGAGSRHRDADDALKRGDCYLGGLAGEDWSRLANDFHR